MAVVTTRLNRACTGCRQAKAKCDGLTPTCGRCSLKGLTCKGMQSEPRGESVFRDENQAARRGSERARQQRRRPKPEFIPLEMASSSEHSEAQAMSSRSDENGNVLFWLNEKTAAAVPEPLPRDRAIRVVERFFVDWTAVSRDDGISTGRELDLPILYSCSMQKSILWLAVNTMALAHVGRLQSRRLSEPRGALSRYGESLSALYQLAHDDQAFANKDVVAGILLLDTFETLYLGRNDPLGPHNTAILYSLRVRANEQFYDRIGFSFWRSVHHRLQTRQLLLGEDVLPEQDEWLTKLNMSFPPLALTSKVHEMLKAVMAARKITCEPFGNALASMEDLRALIADAVGLLDRNETFEFDAAPPWVKDHLHNDSGDAQLEKPNIVDSTNGNKLSTQTFLSSISWAFYCINQVAHRESLMELIELSQNTGEEVDPVFSSLALRTAQQQRIGRLGDVVLMVGQQCVKLLADSMSLITTSPQGRMAIISSISLNMTVLLRTKVSSRAHKTAAGEVLRAMQLHART